MNIEELRKLKKNVRRKVAYALDKGKIAKPIECPNCHSSDSRIDGHHDDYNKPLEIVWLCHSCHIALYHPERNDIKKKVLVV